MMAGIGQVQDITPRIEYVGGSGIDTYTYPFPIIDERDLKFEIDGVTLTLNVDYTVSGVGNESGGSAELTTPTTGGEEVILFRETPVDRLVDYANNGDFRPETVNNDFDRIILMIQELNSNSIDIFDTAETEVGGPICFQSQVTFKNVSPLSLITPTLPNHVLRLGDVNLTDVNLNSIFKKVGVPVSKGDTVLTLVDSFQKAIVIINGVTQLETKNAYSLGPLANQITLTEAIENDNDEVEVWINNLFLLDEKSLRNYSFLSNAQADAQLLVGETFTTIDYSTIGDGGGAKYQVLAPQTVDNITDVTASNANVLVNISEKLDSAMAGVTSAGIDETTKLQSIVNKLTPEKELFISSTKYSLSGFLLFNGGFKKVSHASGSKVTFLGAGELSTTSKALYSVNLDASGARTNETILTTTSAVSNRGDDTFTVNDASGFSLGEGMRVDKHICVVTQINGNIITTDRTLPIREMVIGSEVSRLDIPNTGSTFEGPSLIQFAPDSVTKNYGFGIIAALCIGIKVSGMRSLYNASRLQEIFYCADSSLSDGYQKFPTDNPGGGQSYAARISNGNDNVVSRIKSYKGRHCVDITFSHRNKVIDCDDFVGEFASFLTHFNGCRDNNFIRCNLYNCKFGVFLGGSFLGDGSPEDLVDGDQDNVISDSKFVNSRGLYRMTQLNKAVNCEFLNDVVANFRDVIVPRSNGESVFTMINCKVDVANKFANVDDDFIVNMTGGSYKNSLQDALFRGISSGVPGSPTTTANVTFKFKYVDFDITEGQGRHNLNAKVTFDHCNVEYDEQPFGEDMGDQIYRHCNIKNRNASDRYIVTVGSGNNCEFYGNTVEGTDLYFRFFATFPSTGTITFGDNTLEKPFDVNLLNSMNWTTRGYVSLILARSNNGSPIDGALVYIDSDITTEPFKRKRVSSAWVDWII